MLIKLRILYFVIFLTAKLSIGFKITSDISKGIEDEHQQDEGTAGNRALLLDIFLQENTTADYNVTENETTMETTARNEDTTVQVTTLRETTTEVFVTTQVQETTPKDVITTEVTSPQAETTSTDGTTPSATPTQSTSPSDTPTPSSNPSISSTDLPTVTTEDPGLSDGELAGIAIAIGVIGILIGMVICQCCQHCKSGESMEKEIQTSQIFENKNASFASRSTLQSSSDDELKMMSSLTQRDTQRSVHSTRNQISPYINKSNSVKNKSESQNARKNSISSDDTRPTPRRQPREKVYEDAELYEVYPEMQAVLDDLKQTTRTIRQRQEEEDFEDLYELLFKHVMLPYNECTHKDQQRLLAYHMAKIGFAKTLTSLYQFILEHEGINTFTGKNYGQTAGIRLICLIRKIVDRCTNSNRKLAYKFGQADFLTFMVKDIKVLKRKIDTQMDEGTLFATTSALGVLYSCSKSESNMSYYKELDVAVHVEPFIKSKDPVVKSASLLLLANIVEAEHSPAVVKDESVFAFLVGCLDEAARAGTRQAQGYSTLDITLGITKLSVTDKVKNMVVAQGITPILARLLRKGDSDEREAAALAVWTLAFSADNRDVFQKHPRLISLLDAVREDATTAPDEAAAATGALWLLRDQQLFLDTKSTRERRRKRRGVQPHVMISYNWAQQKTPSKMKARLEEWGYRVWLDADHLDEPMPAARIEAVEGAAAVLVCMSHKYKQGQNNRTEAEYALQLGRPVVPVLTQAAYSPDGWLRRLVGGRAFVDLSKNSKFDKGMRELRDILGEKGQQAESRSDDPEDWTHGDVMDWLEENSLHEEPRFHSLTGKDIAELQECLEQRPRSFNNVVRNNYGVYGRDALYNLHSALSQLGRPRSSAA